MPSSVVRLVTLDHRRLERLLVRAGAPGPSRDRWRREFVLLLRAHHRAEERELYAELPGPLHSDPALQAARHDATVVVRVADQAAEVPVDGEDFARAVETLRDGLTAHVQALEQAVLPAVDAILERKRLRELGGRYEQRRDQELRTLGAHRPVPRRLDYSRAELYELARKAGIEGRSAMTREELIDALMERPPQVGGPGH
jgi:hypothetical protein